MIEYLGVKMLVRSFRSKRLGSIGIRNLEGKTMILLLQETTKFHLLKMAKSLSFDCILK